MTWVAVFFRRWNAWVYFGVLLISNSLLSYFGFTGEIRGGVLLLGVAFPLAVDGWTYRPVPGSGKPLFRQDLLPAFSPWIFGAVLLASLLIRFERLTTLSGWPNYDEGIFGFYALHILNHGIHRLLYASCQIPPFYPAWLGVNFGLWGVSLAHWWFWPALFSLLAVPLAYLAALEYFSPSVAFVCLLQMAFGFWPWILGRYSASVTLIPLLGAWVFLAMGKCLNGGSGSRRRFWAWVLGFSLGAAFYAVFLHWAALAAGVVLTLAWSRFKGRRIAFSSFALALALALLPFLALALSRDLSSYSSSLFLSRQTLTWAQLGCSVFSWTSMVFWGCPPPYYTYEPVWGGLLNPVWGSLVFLGFVEALKNRQTTLYAWLCAGFLVFLLPGVLSVDWEFFRIVPLLAVLLPLAAVGWARLAQALSPGRRAWALWLFLIPAVVLDYHHLMDRYRHLWDSPAFWRGDVKSLDSYRAYGILKPKSQAEGAGLIFSDFVPGNEDQTLAVADYDFNAAANPRLAAQKASWVAVVASVNDRPFLGKFLGPPSDTYWLSRDLPGPDGGRMLWVGPVNDTNRPLLLRWIQADHALTGVIDQSLQTLSYKSGNPEEAVIPSLRGIYPLFQGDPFLQTCFWEKMADYAIKGGRIPEALEYLQQALQSGCPAAQLYYRMGVLWTGLGNQAQARKAFQGATQAPLDFTQSAALLAAFKAPAGFSSRPQ